MVSMFAGKPCLSIVASGRHKPQLFWCKRPVNGALGFCRRLSSLARRRKIIERNTIDGDDLLACVKGEKVLSDDLQAHYVS